MNNLKFDVEDIQNYNAKRRIEEALLDLGFTQGDLSTADILIVHEKTDAPHAGGISQDCVDRLIARGGIYIEYTTGETNWESSAERKFSGSHAELLQRLSRLSPPVSIDDLREALEATGALLTSLVIFCQGYLAAHGGVHLDVWDGIPEELRNQVNTPEKQNVVRKPNWWMQAFQQFPNWKDNLMNEVKALAKQKRCAPEMTEAIDNLVAVFEMGGDSPPIDAKDSQIVHKAYDACKSLLGGGR